LSLSGEIVRVLVANSAISVTGSYATSDYPATARTLSVLSCFGTPDWSVHSGLHSRAWIRSTKYPYVVYRSTVLYGTSLSAVIRDVLLAQQPNKRFATVEELGALSVFLASDAAASITGVALPVDGGWTAH
jgi:hypothetical protein